MPKGIFISFENQIVPLKIIGENDLWYNLVPRYNLTSGFSKCHTS